jgi:integrase
VWRAVQRTEYLARGVRPNHDLVITNEAAGGHWPAKITARFRAIATELGLPRIGVHGLRHSSATALLAAGENPRW